MSRHELFDEIAKHLLHFADTLAERIAALGFYVEGTARMVGDHTAMPPYERGAVDGNEHVKALVDRYARLSAQLRFGIEVSNRLGDPATEDLLTGILGDVEHDLWLLEAHLPVEHAPAVVDRQRQRVAQAGAQRPEPVLVPLEAAADA